jgi:pSer/pThr/pTyr-binding forkhead associated (FHA) protein
VLATADAPIPGAPQRGEWLRALVTLGLSAVRTPTMHLRITESGSASRDFVVGPGEVTVGRSLDCDVVLQQSFVSGRHLRLIDGLVVEDLGSMNGTFLDAVKVERPEVIAGRRLSIGGKDLTLECVHDEGSSRALVAEELETLRRRIDALERASSTGGATPSRRIPTRLPPSDEWSRLLIELVDNDAPRHEPARDISVTEFYILESFKLVRNVETFVTRLAGELVRQFGAGTILPGSDRDHNLRNLLSDIISDPESSEHRDAFLEYQNHLQTWLVVSFNAYKDGSLALVKELRESLRPNVLRRQEPIPALYRAAKLEDLVLWRRAQSFLEELSNNYILDRLDSLACDAANKYIQGKTRGGA